MATIRILGIDPGSRLTGFGVVDWRPGLCLGQHRFADNHVDLGLPDMTIDEAARLGLSYLGASRNQTVARDIDKPLAPGLTENELRAVRFKLDDESPQVRVTAIEVVSRVAPRDQTLMQDLIKMADEAVFKAKENGRNRTEVGVWDRGNRKSA